MALTGVLAIALLFASAPEAHGQASLGDGRFQIIGTGLDISPEAQTVPIGVPTRVDVHLPIIGSAALPSTVSVRGELNGPGLAAALALSAAPNGFFTIPAQTARGTYVLSNIRLVDGESVVAYAAHRDATITVTDILVTQVTSRPLTYQEMVDKGIIISKRDFRGYNFSFSISIESRVISFDVPVLFQSSGPPILPIIPRENGTSPPPESFPIPQIRDIQLKCTGYCPSGDPDLPSDGSASISLPGLLVIPGDIAFLNQFFSVVLLVQNGAPAGVNLRLEDIAAKATLPAGLRMAETNPATNLSDPVPVVDPGPDGKLGTADDGTFLLAQGVGKAEFFVEGLRAGRYEVPIELTATLQGMPTGPMNLAGTTRGAVLVRDPSFFVTLDHPDVIREGEEYTLAATLANTSNVPANQTSIKLDVASVTGAALVSDERVDLGDLAPGDSAIAKFRMRALRTGRVTSTAFIGQGAVAGAVVLSTGVGDLSIPLAPDTLVYPRSVDRIPSDLLDAAKRLLGLSWSLAHSPGTTPPAGLPPVGMQATRWRIDDLIRSSRHLALGEPESTALSDLMLGWLNGSSSDTSSGFDALRRASTRGHETAAAWGSQLSRFWQSEDPFEFQKRIARALPERRILSIALSAGSDAGSPSARLVIAGKALPGRAQLFPEEDGYERSLPSAEIFRASAGGTRYEFALVGGLDPAGYQIQIAGKRSDTVRLTVTYPGADGKLVFASFPAIPVDSGSVAFVDVFPCSDPGGLAVGRPAGSGGLRIQSTNVAPISASIEIAPRPALALLAAVQDLEADPRGHAISLLFNRSVGRDTGNRDSSKYEVRSGFGVNRTQAVLPQELDSRRVIIGVQNHPSPYATVTARVTQLTDAEGIVLAPDPQVSALDVRDRTPGGSVEGYVLGATGQPIPGAEVVLRMPAVSDLTGESFLDDFATTTADGRGYYFFEYIPIRQGTLFTVAAADPTTGYDGDASGQIRSEGQRLELNVVLLGRGDVAGKVRDDAGNPVPGAYVTAESVFFKGERNSASANSAADGSYLFRSLPVGAVQLWAIDPVSRKTAYQAAWIPAAGARATQDIVIVRNARAAVSGTVVREKDGSAAPGAYVVGYGEPVSVPYPPYTDRKYLGFRITDSAGAFAFDDFAPGQDTIEIYDFSRSRSALVSRTITVLPDSQTVLQLVLPEPDTHFGSIAGSVRSSKSGVVAPLPNAVVYVSGTGARATSDSTGHYQLEGVPIGSRVVTAYDPLMQKFVTASALVQEGLTASADLLFVSTATLNGVVLDPLERPVAGAAIAQFDAAGNVLRSTNADSNGRFTFAELPRGTYTFTASGRDDAGGVMRNDAGAVTVTFQADQDFSIVIRFFGFGSVRGKVVLAQVGPDGQPVESPLMARLTLTAPKLVAVGSFLLIADPAHPLYPGADELDSASSDGSYAFAGIFAGAFTLKAHHPLFGDQSVTGSVTRDGQIVAEDFRFQGASSIDGFAYDEKGQPLGGVPVDLWLRSAPPTRDDPLRPPYATVQTVSDSSDARGPGYFRFAAVPDGDLVVAFQGLVNGVRRFVQAPVYVSGSPHSVRVTLRARDVQGVRVHVFEPDASGALQPVPFAGVSIQETEWPGRFFRADTGSDASVLFPGISEGRFTVRAQSLSQMATSGGCVCEDGGATEISVLLAGSGSVRGTVHFPGTNVPVASAQVLLLDLGNPVGAAQTDSAGQYRIDGLLLNRLYSVKVKDNASARFGFSPTFVVAVNGGEAVEDVTLLALGSVDGTFSDAAGVRRILGATVTLTSESLLGSTRFLSGTDGGGVFTFGGIPQGTFSLSAQDPMTKLVGSGSGRIESEAQTITVDLRSQAAGTVRGNVLDSSGGALSVAPAVTVTAPGVTPQTVLSGSFTFENVPIGVPWTIIAEEQVSPPRHRAVATGTLSSNGELGDVTLRYEPYGTVAVRVVRVAPDGSETAADRGSAWILNLGVYGNQFPFGYPVALDANGRASFSRVGGGAIRAVYNDPVNHSNTSADGALNVEGGTVEIVVRVYSTATVSGRVVQSPSADPAPGTSVTLTTNNVPRSVVTGPDGRFSFDGVPFVTGRLELRNDPLPGRAIRVFALSAGNAPLDVGDVVLDRAPPFVGSASPPSGSTGVPRNSTLTAIFSEPVTTSNSGSIQAVAADHLRTGSVALTSDRRTLSFVPTPPLLPNTTYEFRIGADAVLDDGGWPLASSFSSRFTTVNDGGPAVTLTAPAANATQVPVGTAITIVFDSDIDPSSVPGSVLLEETVPPSGAVSGSAAVGANSKTIVFTPSAPLAAESQYRATVWGARSVSGVAMLSPIVFPFWTTDNSAPTVAFDPPPGGPFYTNATVPLAVSWTAADIRSIAIRANGSLVTTLSPQLADRSARFGYFVGTDPSPRILTASAADYSGNTGAAATLTLPVTIDAPPAVAIQVTSATTLAPGGLLTGRVTASDDRSLTSLALYVSGAFSAATAWTDVAGLTSVARDFSITVPPSAGSGGALTIRAEAADNNERRQVSSANDTSVRISPDSVPPVISNVTPANGTTVLPGANLQIDADVVDNIGVWSVGVDAPFAGTTVRSGNHYTVYFHAPQGTGDFTATLRATDFGANSTAVAITFHLGSDDPPAGTITVAPDTPVLPLHKAHVRVDASDDHALRQIVISWTGATTSSYSIWPTGLTFTAGVDVTLPLDAAPGATVSVVADISDAQGHTVRVGPATITVAADATPPVFSNLRPGDGATFVSGDNVRIGADASDDVFVSAVDVVVDGTTTTLTTAPYEITYRAKPVAAPTTVPIRFVARDYAGNSASLDRSITVSPLSDPNAPTIALTCPSTRALVPAGYRMGVAAVASDTVGVARVEFSIDDSSTPFATAVSPPYAASYDVPTDLAPGTSFRIRARAINYANNVGTAESVVTIVAGTVISTDTVIFDSTTTYDDQTLIVTGGTTTISGAHPFADLIVLDGGRITSEGSTAFLTSSLDLTRITGRVYIGCGGSIDVDGKGYLGGWQNGNASSSGLTAGNIPGSAFNTGGSYGGLGGFTNSGSTGSPAATYGDLRDPVEAGSGGGGYSTCCHTGGDGGGRVRLRAASVVVDGAISARGGQGNQSGGSGGAIRIDAATVSGAGIIAASGAAGRSVGPDSGAGGGGGRIAIYADVSGFGRSGWMASGGPAENPASGAQSGGAGTVFLKSPGSADGELRIDNGGVANAARTPLLPLGTAYRFDRVTASNRAKALSADDVIATFDVDSNSYFATPSRDAAPTVAVTTTPAGTVPGNSTLTITVAAEDDNDLARVDVDVAGNPSFSESRTQTDTRSKTEIFVLDVPASTAAGTLQITATVTDSPWGKTATASTSVTVDADLPPTGTISFSPAGPVLPGTTVTSTVVAADDRGLRQITFATWGVVNSSQSVFVSGTGATRSFQFTIPVTASAGSVANVNVQIRDTKDQVTTVTSSVTVAGDITAPVVTNPRPANGSSVSSGTVLAVGIDAADDVGVASVDIAIDAATTTLTAAPYQVTYTAKAVTVDTVITIRFVARDYAGNATTVNQTLAIKPLADPGIPKVSWACPTTGALAPAGIPITLIARATDDQAVQKVEFYADAGTTPFATVSSAPYQTTYTISTSSVDGATVTLRAKVYDFASNTAEASTIVTVAQGDVISTTGTITPTDLSHDGHTVIITGGTTTIDGPHAFARLIVLSGAKLTSLGSTPSNVKRVQLTIAGEVYVACGGSIDVSGKGFGAGATWTGVAAPCQYGGGAYGGQGGSCTGATYGSLLDPEEPGGGGGANVGGGGSGGGSIVLSAGGAIVDGSVLADGTPVVTGGAGGGIRLDIGPLAGSGLIRAAGASSTVANNGSGGGGRIAIRSTDLSGFDLSRISAPGAAANIAAAAGTVLLKSGSQANGELIIDNLGTSSLARTVLPSIGSGTVTAVSGVTITDSARSANFPFSLAGLYVDIRRAGVLVRRFGVVSQSGKTLTLDSSADGIVQVGDAYQGVLKLDNLIIRNGAKVTTSDFVEGFDAPPTATISTSTPNPILPGKTISISVSAADDWGLTKIAARATGAASFSQTNTVLGLSSTQTFAIPVPVTAAAGSTVQVFSDVTDSSGQTTTIGPSIVVIAADVTSPVLTNPTPANGSSFASTKSITVGITATDDVAVGSVDITVDGATTTKITAPYQIVYVAKTVTEPTPVAIRFVARDLVGNAITLDETITINPDGPPTVTLCPSDGALMPSGYTAALTASATDDVGVTKVEFYLNADTAPFATKTTSPYTTTYAIPPGFADGTTFTLHARAYDTGGHFTDSAMTKVTIVSGDLISTTSTIAASDLSHENHTVIVTGGTTTIAGPHTFASLIVLNGATVTSPAPTLISVDSLTVTTTATTYVGCGGLLSVNGKGYLGGLRSGNGMDGLSAPGIAASTNGSGGSSGGAGAGPSAGAIFGNVLDPRDSGGGGASELSFSAVAGNGGGTIRVTAPALVLDGLIQSNGDIASTSGGGAGGSIRLDLGSWSGLGFVRSSGGRASSTSTNNGSGGGGRIAIYCPCAASIPRASLISAGALNGTVVSGAGTVFLKSDAELYGGLLVDNLGLAGAPVTSLPSIGQGTVSSVAGSTLTDSSKSFPYSVAGLFLEIQHAGSPVGAFRVLGQNGGTLTLDRSLEGLVQAGDIYQGVLKLDSITVRGAARVATMDRLDCPAINVDTTSGSSLTAANYP